MSYRKKITQGVFFLQLLGATVIILSIFVISNYISVWQSRDVEESVAAETIGTYSVYPNFWQAGSSRWTAKRYFLVYGSKNEGFNLTWVWSGPYPGTDSCDYTKENCRRQVIYQNYTKKNPDDLIGTASSYKEWEEWVEYYPSANVFRYGNASQDKTKISYQTQSNCNADTNRGNKWPDAIVGNVAWVKESVKHPDGYCTKEYTSSDPKGGGYIAVAGIEDWQNPNPSDPNSYRNLKCNAWFPITGNYNTVENKRVNKVCKYAPRVGIFQNRYSFGYNKNTNNNSYGCEMVIYAWGYPYNINNLREWFRNGPLRYTEYKPIGGYGKIEPTKNDWWNNMCTGSTAPNGNVWESEPNWYYNGIYRLDNNTPVVDNF